MWSFLTSIFGGIPGALIRYGRPVLDFLVEHWQITTHVLALTAGLIIGGIWTDGPNRIRDTPSGPAGPIPDFSFDRLPTEADTAGTARPQYTISFELFAPDTVQTAGTKCEAIPTDWLHTQEELEVRWTTIPSSFEDFHVAAPEPLRIGSQEVRYSYYDPEAGRSLVGVYEVPDPTWRLRVEAFAKTSIPGLIHPQGNPPALETLRWGLETTGWYRRVGLGIESGAIGLDFNADPYLLAAVKFNLFARER